MLKGATCISTSDACMDVDVMLCNKSRNAEKYSKKVLQKNISTQGSECWYHRFFILYVNDLPDWIKTDTKTFADDMKLRSRVSRLKDAESLQDDLGKLKEWSEKWLVKFKADNAKLCM